MGLAAFRRRRTPPAGSPAPEEVVAEVPAKKPKAPAKAATKKPEPVPVLTESDL